MLKRFVSWLRQWEFHTKRLEFYRDWARSIERREPLPAFLAAEIAISRAKHTANPARAAALTQMLARFHAAENMPLSQVVGLSMPAEDRLMLSAGDTLEEKDFVVVVKDLCEAIEIQSASKAILWRSLITPMMILPGVGVFAYVLSAKSIPIIEEFAPASVWTPFNSAVRMVANVINVGGPYIILAALLGVAAMAWALPNWRNPLRFKLEKIQPKTAFWLIPIAPWLTPLSIYRDFQALLILSTLAVLLKRGRTLNQALESVATNGTPYVRHHMRRIIFFLEEAPLEVSKAFATGILSPNVSARLATISRTNPSFEEVLIEIGTTGSVEITKQVQKAASGMNIMLLCLAAFMTVFLYIGQLNLSFTLKKEMDPNVMMQRKMEGG